MITQVQKRPIYAPTACANSCNGNGTLPYLCRLSSRPSWPAGERMRRKWILTREVLARIPAMVASGSTRQVIADALGCKLSTLQVRCSQNGISLRRRKRPETEFYTNVRLNRDVVTLLRDRAARNGETVQALARRLLETIAQEDLYDAVLDEEAA